MNLFRLSAVVSADTSVDLRSCLLAATEAGNLDCGNRCDFQIQPLFEVLVRSCHVTASISIGVIPLIARKPVSVGDPC